MRPAGHWRFELGLLLLATAPTWATGQDVPHLEGPRGDAGVVRPDDAVIGTLEEEGLPSAVPGLGEAPRHEALPDAEPRARGGSAPQAPPDPREERPIPAEPPVPGARWIAGYWEWSPDRGEFTWIPGVWHMPPGGGEWVEGRWEESSGAWVRVPGHWVSGEVARRDWRRDGPPSVVPDDPPGTPPGPGYFFVPGQYVPDGDTVTWRSGFWSKSQPGWRWTPDRWAVREDGWRFEPGRWESLAGGPRGRSVGGVAETDPARLPEAIDPSELAPLPESSAGNSAAGSSRIALRPVASATVDRVDSGVTRTAAVPPGVLTSIPRDSAGAIPSTASSTPASSPRGAIPGSGPSAPSSTLLAWADRLAGESGDFYRRFAAAGGTVPEAGSILYEAQQLHLAALALRQAAARGAGVRELLAAGQQAEGWWGRLAGRVQRVSGGRVGPSVAQVLAMGRTVSQVRASLPVGVATPRVAEPLPEAPAFPAGSSPPPYGAPPPYAAMGQPPRRPVGVGGLFRGLGGRLLRPR